MAPTNGPGPKIEIMATLDYLKQATISSQRRHQARMQEHGRLFSRPSFTIMVWAMLDFFSALVAGFIAFRIRLDPVAQPTSHAVLRHLEATAPLISIAYLVVFCFYLVVFARLYGLYRSPEVRSGLNEQRLTMQATLTAGLMLCGTLYVMKQYTVSRVVVALTIVLTMALLMARRAMERKMIQRRFLQGRETRNVLIVGNGRVAHALRNHLQALPHMGFRFMGFVSLNNEESEGPENSQVIGNIQNCVALARSLTRFTFRRRRRSRQWFRWWKRRADTVLKSAWFLTCMTGWRGMRRWSSLGSFRRFLCISASFRGAHSLSNACWMCCFRRWR